MRELNVEDRDTIDRVLSGDNAAFEVLVRKYHRLGGAISFGVLGDFELAEDVVQDAFLKAFRSLSSLRSAGKFRLWFSGIVRKRAIDVLRQRKSKLLRASSLDTAAEDGGSAAGSLSSDARRPDKTRQDLGLDRMARLEERQKILECIGSLATEDRTVVVLKHMEGYSYKEIAELTGATVSAVESRLFRARQALKQKLYSVLKMDSPEQ